MVAGFIVASFSLFMGAGIYSLIQYGDNLLIASSFLLALILDIGIGWTLHQHTGRRFRLTIALSSAGIVAGAIATSILVWRGHWVQLVKELLRVT